MNQESITLKINASDLSFSNLIELQKLKLPKELFNISSEILEDHNKISRLLFRYSLMLIFLFFIGIILILFLFQYIFLESYIEYFWIIIPILGIGFVATYFYTRSQKQSLIQKTLNKLTENSFEVLIINKKTRIVSIEYKSNLSDGLENNEDFQELIGLEIRVNHRRLEKYINDKYRHEGTEIKEESSGKPEVGLRF